jgi:hypothetical protein
MVADCAAVCKLGQGLKESREVDQIARPVHCPSSRGPVRLRSSTACIPRSQLGQIRITWIWFDRAWKALPCPVSSMAPVFSEFSKCTKGGANLPGPFPAP